MPLGAMGKRGHGAESPSGPRKSAESTLIECLKHKLCRNLWDPRWPPRWPTHSGRSMRIDLKTVDGRPKGSPACTRLASQTHSNRICIVCKHAACGKHHANTPTLLLQACRAMCTHLEVMHAEPVGRRSRENYGQRMHEQLNARLSHMLWKVLSKRFYSLLGVLSSQATRARS
jgi:hypothetical protein